MGLLQTLVALLPALALVAMLLLGRFPGEEVIARMAAKRQTERPRPPIALRPKARPKSAEIRTGELLARSLATRPPPAAFA